MRVAKIRVFLRVVTVWRIESPRFSMRTQYVRADLLRRARDAGLVIAAGDDKLLPDA
jgi:hypothetical protein